MPRSRVSSKEPVGSKFVASSWSALHETEAVNLRDKLPSAALLPEKWEKDSSFEGFRFDVVSVADSGLEGV